MVLRRIDDADDGTDLSHAGPVLQFYKLLLQASEIYTACLEPLVAKQTLFIWI